MGDMGNDIDDMGDMVSDMDGIFPRGGFLAILLKFTKLILCLVIP